MNKTSARNFVCKSLQRRNKPVLHPPRFVMFTVKIIFMGLKLKTINSFLANNNRDKIVD